jgi:hypothetical protein
VGHLLGTRLSRFSPLGSPLYSHRSPEDQIETTSPPDLSWWRSLSAIAGPADTAIVAITAAIAATKRMRLMRYLLCLGRVKEEAPSGSLVCCHLKSGTKREEAHRPKVWFLYETFAYRHVGLKA